MVYTGSLQPKLTRGNVEAGKQYSVAIKEMKGDRAVRLNELLKESRVMASVKHKNLCQFLGICANLHVHGSKQYILSELMDCSLFDLVHKPQATSWLGDFTVMTTLYLTEDMCAGLAHLHDKRLVHADLKSSNILVDYSSSNRLLPKICDFGHAAVRTQPTPHHRCGTPHWAAPEVLRSEAISQSSDIFSIGVMLWETLTRELPHRNLTFSQVLGAVGWAGWLPAMELLPEIPPGLRALLSSTFSFSPTDRPSAMELRTQLRRIRRQARGEAFHMLSGLFGSCC